MKWILRYLRGTSKVCLGFGSGEPMLDGYTDSDMASDVDSKKSISGFLMTFARGEVSWKSKLFKLCCIINTEAKCIVILRVVKKFCG